MHTSCVWRAHARLAPAALEYWHNYTSMCSMGKKGASRGQSNANGGKGMIQELVFLYCAEVGGKTRVKCEKEAQ